MTEPATHPACGACGATLRTRARFCPSCGAPTDDEVEARTRRRRLRAKYDRRIVGAIATVFAGTVVAVGLLYRLELTGTIDTLLSAHAVFYGLVVVTGTIGIVLLGRGAARASFAGGGTPAWWGLGAILGAAGFGVSFLYVEGMYAAYGVGSLTSIDLLPLDLVTVISVALLPALFEEWLTRGVLWNACVRVTTPGRTILITAILFAFMHGVGGHISAYPHRFVGGLIAGWLRHRSKSLVPGVVEHFTHNFLCIVAV